MSTGTPDSTTSMAMPGVCLEIRQAMEELAGLAVGNIAMEDTIDMLEEMGISTGINLDAMIAAARLASERLGHSFSGVLKAGTSQRLVDRYSGARVKTLAETAP